MGKGRLSLHPTKFHCLCLWYIHPKNLRHLHLWELLTNTKNASTKCDIAGTYTTALTPLSFDSLRTFLYDPVPTELFGEVGTYLNPSIAASTTPVHPIEELGNLTVLDISSLEQPTSFTLNMHLHLAQPIQCILLSQPVFSRDL